MTSLDSRLQNKSDLLHVSAEATARIHKASPPGNGPNTSGIRPSSTFTQTCADVCTPFRRREPPSSTRTPNRRSVATPGLMLGTMDARRPDRTLAQSCVTARGTGLVSGCRRTPSEVQPALKGGWRREVKALQVSRRQGLRGGLGWGATVKRRRCSPANTGAGAQLLDARVRRQDKM